MFDFITCFQFFEWSACKLSWVANYAATRNNTFTLPHFLSSNTIIRNCQLLSIVNITHLNFTPSNIPVVISEGHTVVNWTPVTPVLDTSRRNDSMRPTAANFDEQ